MGLLFLFIVLLLISILLLVIGCCIDGIEHPLSIVSVILIFAFGVAVFVCVIGTVCTQCFIDAEYQKMLLRKEEIEFRIEHQGNLALTYNEEDTNLYDSIRHFNQAILDNKTFKDNWWVGCFYNWKVATIDYIDLESK